MNSKKILLAALSGALWSPAFAAAPEAEGDAGQQRRVVTHERVELRAPAGGLGMHFPGSAMRMLGKPVKNAPYSAEVVSERQQNLADGNQIVNKTTSLSYRDSAGRTRQEMRDANGEVQTVTISDPVESVTYVLSPRTKTATKISVDKAIGKAAAEAARARIEQLRKDGKLPAGERREIIIRQFNGPEGEIKVQAPAQTFSGRFPRDLTVQLGPLAGAMADMKWAQAATSKDLGTREIEGIKAEGKLRSYEIPAGEVGNRNPIVVSHESWYSPELQVTLLSKHSDPRIGDNTYRLTVIRRDEPDAALFAVPSDYTVKDAMANVTRMIEKKAP